MPDFLPPTGSIKISDGLTEDEVISTSACSAVIAYEHRLPTRTIQAACIPVKIMSFGRETKAELPRRHRASWKSITSLQNSFHPISEALSLVKFSLSAV
jgi:hypothetical protein